METKRVYLIAEGGEGARVLLKIARIFAERGAPFRFYAEPGTMASRVLDEAKMAYRSGGPIEGHEPRAVVIAAEQEPSKSLREWVRFAADRASGPYVLFDPLTCPQITWRFPTVRSQRLPMTSAELSTFAALVLRDGREEPDFVGDEDEPHIVRGVD